MAIAKEFDFDVYTTDERGGNIMAGPSITYLVGNSSADVVLFMEKDFVLNADKETTARELYHGMYMISRGIDVYRLRGNSDWPAEGMPNCCSKSDPPECPYHSNWRSGGYFSDHQNWLNLWCQEDPVESGNGRLAKCTEEPEAPRTYCFGSGDSGWSALLPATAARAPVARCAAPAPTARLTHAVPDRPSPPPPRRQQPDPDAGGVV